MNFLTNWRTTLAGAAAIAGALAALLKMLSTGSIDPTLLWTNLGIISAGVMGLFARDASTPPGKP
jgi:hypothetical protein